MTIQRRNDDPRIRYALSILLGSSSSEDFAWPPWLIYGDPREFGEPRGVCIVPSGLFAESYGTPQSLPSLPLASLEGTPILFGIPQVECREGIVVVHADILASAYFLVTRYEEWIRPDVRDEHGRFPGRESLPFRAGFLHRPIVEEYHKLLRRWAQQVGIALPCQERSFSVLLTHDIDSLGVQWNLMRPLRSAANVLLGRQSVKQAATAVAMAAGWKDDPADNLEDVVRADRQLSDRFGPDRCQSVYFFLAGGRSKLDGAYSLRARRTQRAICSVLASGSAIGLHASYQAGECPRLIAEERRCLERIVGSPIVRNRHHYLRWREPADSAEVASAGIKWDSSLGYADVAGFRLGVCHPIPLFDPIHNCLLGIEEHPLLAMDTTLSSQFYMGLDQERAFHHVLDLAKRTHQYCGEFVLLWHNTSIAGTAGGYHRALYARILTSLSELLDCDRTHDTCN